MTTDCLFALESEIESCMEVLLRAIVSEVADIFRTGPASASGDPFRDQVRRSSGMLVRRVAFTLTKFLQGSFGGEIAQMKQEIETLKGRLRVWEQAAGSGGDGDLGQTDRLGHTPPCEVIVQVKEETDAELELSGGGWPEAGGLPDAGDGAPLEQQRSEEEEEEEEEEGWGSGWMQETELPSTEGKEQLGEQHRSRVEDLGGPYEQRPEGVAGCRQPTGDRDVPSGQGAGALPHSVGRAESVSVRGQKEEERGDLGAGQAAEVRAAERPAGGLGEERADRGGSNPGAGRPGSPPGRPPGPPPARRPFACGQCGLSFSRSGSLKRHWLTHTGERPFGCRLCGRGFGRLGNLRRHELIHTGERRLRCGHCGKTFSRSDHYKNHRLLHGAGGPRPGPQASGAAGP